MSKENKGPNKLVTTLAEAYCVMDSAEEYCKSAKEIEAKSNAYHEAKSNADRLAQELEVARAHHEKIRKQHIALLTGGGAPPVQEAKPPSKEDSERVRDLINRVCYFAFDLAQAVTVTQLHAKKAEQAYDASCGLPTSPLKKLVLWSELQDAREKARRVDAVLAEYISYFCDKESDPSIKECYVQLLSVLDRNLDNFDDTLYSDAYVTAETTTGVYRKKFKHAIECSTVFYSNNIEEAMEKLTQYSITLKDIIDPKVTKQPTTNQ